MKEKIHHIIKCKYKSVIAGLKHLTILTFQGKTAYSLYACPGTISKKAHNVFNRFPGIMEGEQWFQGDHMIFVQKGIPSIAFTAEKMPELMATYTHTPKDAPDIVDCAKLVEVAYVLQDFIKMF